MITESSPEYIVSAIIAISTWCDKQSESAQEEGDYWDWVIRARALDEATSYIKELQNTNANMVKALEDIASGRYSGVILTSFPPKDPAVERARAALAKEKKHEP